MKTAEQYKKLTISEFTKAAEIYETDHAGIYEMCKDDYPYIEAELSHIEYQDLLDCGCGTGPMISLLHEKDSLRHYVGLDITPRMIEVAKSKNLKGTEWTVGDCENAGLQVEKLKRARKMRMHLVARKKRIEVI